MRIQKAISSKFKLKIKYNNKPRIVEVHILGYNHDNQLIIRVFELLRDSIESNQFKLYLVSEIQSLTLSKEKFVQSVNKPTDEAMSKIILTTYNNGKKKKED